MRALGVRRPERALKAQVERLEAVGAFEFDEEGVELGGSVGVGASAYAWARGSLAVVWLIGLGAALLLPARLGRQEA